MEGCKKTIDILLNFDDGTGHEVLCGDYNYHKIKRIMIQRFCKDCELKQKIQKGKDENN